jgi:hypothetical protein
MQVDRKEAVQLDIRPEPGLHQVKVFVQRVVAGGCFEVEELLSP